MNLGEIRDLAYKLADIYSSEGDVLPSADTADAKLAMTDFINTAQNKWAEKEKIETVYSISQNPVENLLSDTTSDDEITDDYTTAYDITQHLDEDITWEATGAQSYTLEVDKPATIYFEEEIGGVWTNLTTLTVAGITSYTEYKGLLTPSDTDNDVRVRFSGSYIYNIRNVALYAYTFASTDDIPQFRPWNKYALPTGYISANRIVYSGNDRLRKHMTDHFIENGYFVVRHELIGEFQIYYNKKPTALASDTDIPEINGMYHNYLAYFAAGEWLLATGETAKGITRLNQFDAFLAEMKPNADGSSNEIENITGW